MGVREVIVQRVVARCAFPTGERVPAELRYAADEPYGVQITVDDDPAAVHEVARTLLVQGITGATGMGDARAWPMIDRTGRALVVLHLRSAQDEVVLELLTTQLDLFLGRTLALVPLGDESQLLDVDGVVAQLLAAGDA